jgi:hypothetical protein
MNYGARVLSEGRARERDITGGAGMGADGGSGAELGELNARALVLRGPAPPFTLRRGFAAG